MFFKVNHFFREKQNTWKVIIVNYIIFLKEKKTYSIALKKTVKFKKYLRLKPFCHFRCFWLAVEIRGLPHLYIRRISPGQEIQNNWIDL